jgi:hypothetical protein
MSVTGWVLTFVLFTFLFYLLHSHKKEREFTITTATRAINRLTSAIQEANSKGTTNIFHADNQQNQVGEGNEQRLKK